MATTDTCVTVVPYIEIPEGEMDRARALFEKFVAKTQEEEGCLYYGFSFNGNLVHCREAYADGDACLAHVANVGEMLGELLSFTKLQKLEIHGPEAELAKLRGPLGQFNPTYFVLEYGFRK